ncbi:MAG: hypothetical protein ILA52_01545, partial [Alphaproteobacteria bacterium]|nr:hypothetical protein [Alphaproteobacteria bacterium]
KIFAENMLDDNAVKLITYNQKGKVLDEIWLGKRTADGESAVIRRKNGKYFYTINEVTDFSGEAQDWVPYPLLNIDSDIIKKVAVNGTEFSAEKLQKILPYSKKWLSLFNTLRFIDYQGIEYKKALDNVKVHRTQEIEVTIIGGLIYKLTIYDVGDSFWLAVTLASEKVAHKDVVTFVKNNQMYFADWIFQLNEEQGQVLCNTDYITGESAVPEKL